MSGGGNDYKSIRKYIVDWSVPTFAVVLVVGIIWFFILWPDRNYGQLTTSLITVLGVVVTLWVTQVRTIEQQEKEDERHHARLEAEAKMHNERLSAEAEKDRAQRSITQRIDLAEKLTSAINHLSSDNELQQAAGVQEILFQIDDWRTLIDNEIAGLSEKGGGYESVRRALQRESSRHRQELFDIAYKFKTKNIEVLKSRARGLKKRLSKKGSNSLFGIDFSDVVVGVGDCDITLDLRGIFAVGCLFSNASLFRVDMSMANLERSNFENAILDSVNFEEANLESANIRNASINFSCLLCVKMESVDARNANLESSNMWCAELKTASLRGANLRFVDLRNAQLESADLRSVRLESSDLRNANLNHINARNANLESSNMWCAELKTASLRGANLRFVDLRNAQLESADLRNANLEHAEVGGAIFVNAKYNCNTIFPEGFVPGDHGMILIDDMEAES